MPGLQKCRGSICVATYVSNLDTKEDTCLRRGGNINQASSMNVKTVNLREVETPQGHVFAAKTNNSKSRRKLPLRRPTLNDIIIR